MSAGLFVDYVLQADERGDVKVLLGCRAAEICATSLSGGTLRVTNLRQEPYAVVPHVRICAGGGR